MADPGFELLYENGPCLVLGKPPGLLTQAPPGVDSLEARLHAFLIRRAGGVARSGGAAPDAVKMVHRLDRPASGALLVGLSRKAVRKLARQFEKRYVEKRYWVCVAGLPEPPDGSWEDHVRKIPGEPRAEVVAADRPDARRAVLHYRTLRSLALPAGAASWLEVTLETGRTHQIRVQAAGRGHAVLGDSQYGSTHPFGEQHADERLRAIALHARLLGFRDPTTERDQTVTAAPPAAWAAFGPLP
ncbi:MAG: RluA family pseudouridine synthase [Candidatus Krumholzibacteriia bacterium]